MGHTSTPETRENLERKWGCWWLLLHCHYSRSRMSYYEYMCYSSITAPIGLYLHGRRTTKCFLRCRNHETSHKKNIKMGIAKNKPMRVVNCGLYALDLPWAKWIMFGPMFFFHTTYSIHKYSYSSYAIAILLRTSSIIKCQSRQTTITEHLNVLLKQSLKYVSPFARTSCAVEQVQRF